MGYTEKKLDAIFARTDGRCHICGKGLCRKNYSRPGSRGAWEVEHSRPRVGGGTDHGNNLYAAHIRCNREKGTLSTRTARSQHGRTRAPMSRAKRQKARRRNAAVLGTAGGLMGSFFGPIGTCVGAALGAKIGYDADPEQ